MHDRAVMLASTPLLVHAVLLEAERRSGRLRLGKLVDAWRELAERLSDITVEIKAC